MKNLSLITGTLLLLSLLTSCDDDEGSNCVGTDGPIITETLALDNFHSIHMKGVGSIFLTQGSPQSLSVTTHEMIHDLLDYRVSGEELTIELTSCIQGQIDRLDFFITIPEIKNLSLDGVGNIVAENDFDLDELKINLNGVGNITLRGETSLLDISSTGVGNISAFDLVSETCDLILSGSGNAQVTVTDSFNVTISGTGNVSYKGHPALNVNVTGTGNLTDAN